MGRGGWRGTDRGGRGVKRPQWMRDGEQEEEDLEEEEGGREVSQEEEEATDDEPDPYGYGQEVRLSIDVQI